MFGRWIPAFAALSLAVLLTVGLWATGGEQGGLSALMGATLVPAAPADQTAVAMANSMPTARTQPRDAEELAVRGPHPRQVVKPTTQRVNSQASERERAATLLASRGAATGRLLHVSWYGAEFQGLGTANGEKFDRFQMTAAHRTLPFGTILRLTNPGNGHTVEVRVNDRGPWVAGRDLDLSEAAFAKLAPLGAGVLEVTAEVLQK